MKRFVLFILAVLFIGTFLGGCTGVDGVAYSQTERESRVKTINDIYDRQFVDDCDAVFLYDRPTYLTEWPVRDTD